MEHLQVFIRKSFYEGSLPAFYDSQDFPELNEIADNWQIIRDELLEYEKTIGFKGVDTYNSPGLGDADKWNNIYIDNFLWRKHGNYKLFPKTMSLIEKIPNYSYAAFSILSPGGEIKAHYGDTNGIIRCHLGLIVPGKYPECGIRVKDQESDWTEGKFTLFTEAHLHNTWNYSGSKRYILVIDLIHPYFRDKRWLICSSVLGAQSYNYVERKFPFLFKRIPYPFLKPIHWILTLMWFIYLPIQRKFQD